MRDRKDGGEPSFLYVKKRKGNGQGSGMINMYIMLTLDILKRGGNYDC